MAEEKDKQIEALKQELKQTRDLVNALVEKQEQAYNPVKTQATNAVQTVQLRFVDEKPIVGFRNVGTETRPKYFYTEVDPNDKNNRITYAEVYLLNEETPIKIPFVEFIRESEARVCEIVSVKNEPWTTNQGITPKRVLAPAGNNMMETGQNVAIEIKGVKSTYVLRSPEYPKLGEFEVPQHVVNM